MIKIIFSLLLFILASGSVLVAEPLPSDADICTGLVAKAVENIISDKASLIGPVIRLRNTQGVRLSSLARETVESIITHRNYSLTNATHNADTILDIAVTDVSIVLQKQQEHYSRTVSLSVHHTLQNKAGLVLYATGSLETKTDSIPDKKTARLTDDGHKFGKDVNRTVIADKHHKLMAATLLVIVGILTYYSAQ